MAKHGRGSPGIEIHVPFRWAVANAAARTAINVGAVYADDVGSLAWQQDDNTIWLAKATGTGAGKWQAVGAGAGAFTESTLRTVAATLTATLGVNGQVVSNAGDPVSAQDLVTKAYFDANGATIVSATPSAGTDTTMATIALSDNTIYNIVVEMTARDSGNNLHSAYHSQKWARTGGGVASLIQSLDPVQVNGIAGVGATASRLIASSNNVLLKWNPGAISTRYLANVYVNSYGLTHI